MNTPEGDTQSDQHQPPKSEQRKLVIGGKEKNSFYRLIDKKTVALSEVFASIAALLSTSIVTLQSEGRGQSIESVNLEPKSIIASMMVSTIILCLRNIEHAYNYDSALRTSRTYEGRLFPRAVFDELGLTITALHDSQEANDAKELESNAYVVHLSEIFVDNILSTQASESDSVMQDVLRLRFEAIRTALDNNPAIKTVYVEVKGRDISSGSYTELDAALKKYNLKSSPASHGYTVFSRQEIYDLTRDSQSIISDALEALADPELSALYTLLCDPSCPNSESVLASIQTRIHRLLDTEVAKSFQASYLAQGAFDADNPNQRYAHRQRISPFTQLRRTDKGFYFVEVDTHAGSTTYQPFAHVISVDDPEYPHPHPQHIPLEQLISVSDQPIDDILASRSIYQRAQLLYVLDYILRSTPAIDLSRPLPTIDDVRERMENLGIEFIHKNKEPVLRSKLKKLLYGFGGGLGKNLLTTAIIFPFVQLALNSYDTIEQRAELAQPIGEVQGSSSALTSERPPSIPQWKITSSFDTRGLYWVQQTSTGFVAGEQSWVFGTSILTSSEPQSYPPLSDALLDEHYLTIEQGTTNLLSYKYLHIPSPQHMSISHASLVLEDGTHIPAVVRRSESGGYLMLMSDQDLDQAPYAVKLAIRFTPDSTRATRAQSDGFELSEEEHQQLDASTQEIVSQAQELLNSGKFTTFDDALADVIRTRYQYGYDSAETKQLSEQRTSVEFLNTATDARMMQCNTANTLLTMLAEEPRTYATGYINPKITVEKEGYQEGFLTADGKHAFSLDTQGNILDATPTQLSVNQIVLEDNSKLEEDFEASIPKAPVKGIDELEDNLVALLPFAAIAATLLGTMQLSRYMEKHITPDKRREIEAHMIESTSSRENIQIATQFLLHISWNNEKDSFVPRSDAEHDNPIQFLIDNVNYAVIEKYIDKPEDFENESLTRAQKNTCRTLAYFLYHRH